MKAMLTLLLWLAIIPGASAAPLPYDQLLELPPISPFYTQKVLDRADEGLVFIASSAGGTGPFSSVSEKLNWLDHVATAFLVLIDTRLRVEAQVEDLPAQTACLHMDLLLIEAKMEEVRKELLAAYRSGESTAIFQLHSLLWFLNGRYEALHRGATDPTFRDTGMEGRYLFDDPEQTVTCCAPDPNATDPQDNAHLCQRLSSTQCTSAGGVAFTEPEGCLTYPLCYGQGELKEMESDGPFCPFHSNYLPPTSMGFGCDVRAMSGILLHGSTKAESDALQSFIITRNAFLSGALALKDIGQLYADIGGETQATEEELRNFAIALKAEHKAVIGCRDEMGSSSSAYPWGLLYQTGATRWAPRTPFSLETDDLPLLVRLWNVRRTEWAENREFEPDIRYPAEFSSSSLQLAATEEEQNRSPLERIMRDTARRYFSAWHIILEDQESPLIAKAVDAPMRFAEIFDPVQKSIAKLADVAVKPTKSIRGFSREFAYFLRRSCVFRPCNAQLEKILKIVLKDECFPYTKGQYQDDPKIYEKCKAAAEKVY